MTDATVHVPKDYCNWVANKHYTYIFRITKNSNGSTGTTTPKPDDPEVPSVPALYPIVFDNCVVEDWATEDTEWDITGENTPIPYHNITLSAYSVKAGTDITLSITDSDRQKDHRADSTKITVTKKGESDPLPVYTAATKTIRTGTLAAGVYTVTYKCPHYTGANTNHPESWSVDFVVGNTYTLTTEAGLTEVGLGGTLPVTATNTTTHTTPAGTLYIEYPTNVNGSKVKVNADNQIEVAADATPGTYNLCFKTEYTFDGGNVTQVTVAKTPIVVKDYQHTLSTYLVKLGASPVTINITTPTLQTEATEALSVNGTTGISLDPIAKKIEVANTAAEGTYTVTYTVNKDRTSQVVKEATFKVENTYGVTLSKNYIRRDEGRPNGESYGTDYIMVSLFKNGTNSVDATADAVQSSIDITNEAGTSIKTLCYFYGPSSNKIKFKVRKNVPNGTYYVVYTGQTGKVVKAQFTVQN